MTELEFSVGRIAELACVLEVAASKPGNVHRGADFEDTTLEDFLISAVVFGQVIDELSESSVGRTVLVAVERTRSHVGSNTNLGMILLIVPLAKAAALVKLNRPAVQRVLEQLSSDDAEAVFSAIRIANPGGLGTAEKLDVLRQTETPTDLLEAMGLAADRDLVARQYSNDFEQVFDVGVPLLVEARQMFDSLSQAIVFAHVSMMSRFPDSLIVRKCGMEVALHAQMLAGKVIDSFSPDGHSAASLESFWSRVGELDFWLRSDGHHRNPGTTADLIAASLFVAIQTGKLKPPLR